MVLKLLQVSAYLISVFVLEAICSIEENVIKLAALFCTVFTSKHCLCCDITWSTQWQCKHKPTHTCLTECSLWLLPLTSSPDRSVFKFNDLLFFPFSFHSHCFLSFPSIIPNKKFVNPAARPPGILPISYSEVDWKV